MARKDNEDRVTTKVAGYYVKSTIQLGKDKDGKVFGPDNNPRRGSSQDRFKVYKDGMTIEDALKGGLQRSDIRSDLKKGYIAIKGVPMPESEKPAPAPKADKKADTKAKGDAKGEGKAEAKAPAPAAAASAAPAAAKA